MLRELSSLFYYPMAMQAKPVGLFYLLIFYLLDLY